MDENLKRALIGCDTDLDGVLHRFGGDEALYVRCLASFLNDPTVEELGQAILLAEWDDAFTAAHAIKGLAGNMGFVPLFQAAARTVVLIRNGRVNEVQPSYLELKRAYNIVTNVIQQYCSVEEHSNE